MKLLVVLAAGLLLSGDAPTDAVKTDMKALEGEWTMVKGEREGQPLPDEMTKTGKRVSKDGETKVIINGEVMMKAKYTVDPSKKPKAIDYTVLEGPIKDKNVLGIYELDGDTVKFCFATPGTERPKDFTSKEDDGRTSSVWKRAKK